MIGEYDGRHLFVVLCCGCRVEWWMEEDVYTIVLGRAQSINDLGPAFQVQALIRGPSVSFDGE